MKKIFNTLLITMISLLVVPFVVSAEIKTFGDIQYTIETEDIKDFLCEEIKDHQIYFEWYDINKLRIADITDINEYIIDLTKPGVCIDFDGSDPDLDSSSYIWGSNNDIYEVVYEEGLNEEWHYISDLEARYPLIKSEGQYDADAEYYEIIINGENKEAVLVENKNETDFNARKYYTILEPTSKKLLATFKTNNFVAPKEKTGLDSDILYAKDNFLWPINFNNKMYYVFIDFPTQYFAVFDGEGNYQTFGYDKLILNYVMDSLEGDYVVLYTEQDGKLYASILDKNYNLLLSKEVTNNRELTFIGKDGSTDYLFEEGDNASSLLSITKSTIKKENVPNTYDGIITSIIVGIVALLGLIVTTILLKRRKSN